MKKRDKWISIIFTVFILVVPAVTFVRGFLPEQQQQTDENAQSVLDQNGTLQGGTKGDGNESEKETEANNGTESDTTWFEDMQTGINTFTDRLFLKTKFIALNTQLTKFITGGNYIESTQVLVGKEDYLFYKTQNDGFPIYDYMGINHFTDDELLQIKNNLTTMRDYFESQGIEFYVFAAPNKESVYEQYMPDTIARINTTTRADQVAEYMWDNADLTYIYPKKELIEESNRHQVYYKTDTHWNQIGAFIGFQEFYEAAYGKKESLDDVKFNISSTEFSGDLALIAGITDDYKVDTAYSIDNESVNKDMFQDRTIFVVGDSFSGFLSTITKAYFEDVHWIYTQDFTMDMVEEYKPDVIIFESVERYIERFRDVNLLEK